MADNYLTKVENREVDLGKLFTRMGEDKDLLYLKEYEMRDAGGKNKVPDIVNVTLNRPAVFAANIISALGNTSEQVIISSSDENFDTHEVEAFRDAGFASADYRLTKQNKSRLDDFIDIQNCIRGRSSARCLFYMRDGVLVPDITPWDTRYVTYELGEDGLKWAAYKTKRLKDAIEAEYPDVKITAKDTMVTDVWDTTHNEVWVDKKLAFTQPHNFGFTPVCIEIVPLGYGSVLMDDDRLKYDGESIFFLIRGAIPELNRLVSIMQTLNLKTIKKPIKQIKRGGSASGEPSSHEELTEMGAVTLMDIGEDVLTIDFGDAQRSAQIAYNMIDKAMQEGSLSSIDLGTLQFQLSAVALIEIGEGRDQVFLPRLKAKAGLKEQLGDMFTRQVIQMGGSVELGTPGHKRTFNVSKLDGQYDTTYKYFVKSPKIDMARQSVANAAIYASEKYKMEHMLQMEDPKGEKQQMTIERAIKTSPILTLDEEIRALIEAGMDTQAKLRLQEMDISLDALLRGDIEQLPEAEKEKPQQMINMFRGGVGGEVSSAKKAAQLQQTPEGEGE